METVHRLLLGHRKSIMVIRTLSSPAAMQSSGTVACGHCTCMAGHAHIAILC